MAKPKLLIVEDDEGLCSQYRWAFPACDVLLSHTRAAGGCPGQAGKSAGRDHRPGPAAGSGWRQRGVRHHRGGAADRAEDQDRRRDRQWRPQARVKSGQPRRLRLLRKDRRDRGTAHDRRSGPEPVSARGRKPPAGEHARALAHRADRHRQHVDAEGLPRRRKARHDQCAGAAAGRKRHREGSAGGGAA